MYQGLVLDSAERVFARCGYRAARMQEVATEAGISLGTLYSVFPGKSEIFAALNEARGETFLAQLEPALHESGRAREALWHTVSAFVHFVMEHRDYFQVDLREGRSWAIGDVEASPTFQKGITQWRELIARGIAEGVFRDEDPGVLAATVFGLMQIQLAAILALGGELDSEGIARRIASSVERQVCRLDVLAQPPPWEPDSARETRQEELRATAQTS
jgi:AcrR family transcriptional regulator